MGHIGISVAGYLMQISDSMEGVVTAEKMPHRSLAPLWACMFLLRSTA